MDDPYFGILLRFNVVLFSQLNVKNKDLIATEDQFLEVIGCLNIGRSMFLAVLVNNVRGGVVFGPIWCSQICLSL